MDVRGWVRESGTWAMSRKRCDRLSRGARAATALLGAAGVALVGAALDPTPTRSDAKVALKIGLLMDFSGGSAEILADRQRAFELAVKHVNEGGGVFALPVAVAVGDTTADAATAVAEARRLVEVEGVHAIVGPNSSAASLRIAERVTGPAGVPTVSFSATSPELTGVADNDFFFRVALSDVLQGPVLARVVREQGIDNVGVVYVDDAWGRGLAGAFEAAWAGTIRSVAVQRDQAGFLSELRQSADAGAKALVVIAPGRMVEALVRESMESGLYDRFAFGDAAKRPGLVRAIGGTHLGGMYGTGPAIAPESPASAAWEAAYVEEHGALPVRAYVKEAYDATVALALAAEAAGSLDGAAVRDRLRAVGGGPGVAVNLSDAESDIPPRLRVLWTILSNSEPRNLRGVLWSSNHYLTAGSDSERRRVEDEVISDLAPVLVVVPGPTNHVQFARYFDGNTEPIAPIDACGHPKLMNNRCG